MKIYLDNNLGVTNVEQEELTQDTIGYNILKVYIPNAVLTPYDTFTCYYGALLQNGRKVGWFAMEARTSSDADYEANYTLYKATLEQCVVSVEGKVYIGCQVLLGNSGNATLIKKNTAVVQFNVRKSVAINNDILVLDTDQTTTDVLESYKNLLENALLTYVTKAEVYTKTQIDSALSLKADKSDTYTKAQVDSALATKADRDATDSRFLLVESAIDDLTSVQNVVEVVATYSALQSYDTSKLDANDKVQVIADETHDGASTIYNWNGSAWQYVGAFGGNSYTKVESDNKFAPKSTAITHTGNQLKDYNGNNIYPDYKLRDENYLGTIYSVYSGSVFGGYYGYSNPFVSTKSFNQVVLYVRITTSQTITITIEKTDGTEIATAQAKVTGNSDDQEIIVNFDKEIVGSNDVRYLKVDAPSGSFIWHQTGTAGNLRASSNYLTKYKKNASAEYTTYSGAAFPIVARFYYIHYKCITYTKVYVATTGNDTTGDGTEDNPFATILKANNSIENNSYYNRYIVVVKSGTYTDLQDYYSNVDPTSYVGVICKDYVYYESETPNDPSNVIINWNGMTGRESLSYNIARYFCPFHILGNPNGMHTHLKGFTFNCVDIRYCLHIECNGYGVGFEWLVENCIFNWGGAFNCTDLTYEAACIGTGSGQFEKGKFCNNKITLSNGATISFQNHDWDWRYSYTPAVIIGAYEVLTNNDFGNGDVQFRSLYLNDANNYDIAELCNNFNIKKLVAIYSNTATSINWRFIDKFNIAQERKNIITE